MRDSPYLTDNNRLADVIAAIQTLSTYKYYKLEFARWNGRFDLKWYHPLRFKREAARFSVVGTIPILPTDPKDSDSYCGWQLLGCVFRGSPPVIPLQSIHRFLGKHPAVGAKRRWELIEFPKWMTSVK